MVFGLCMWSRKVKGSSKNVAAVAAIERAAAAVKVSMNRARLASTGLALSSTGSSGLCGAQQYSYGLKTLLYMAALAVLKRFADVQKETGGTIVVCSNAR
jgi:hypothetical protein